MIDAWYIINERRSRFHITQNYQLYKVFKNCVCVVLLLLLLAHDFGRLNDSYYFPMIYDDFQKPK